MSPPVSRSLNFSDCARVVAHEARAGALGTIPRFRSPPRVVGRDRTIRRQPDGSVVVAVNLAGRPFAAIVADLIEGTIVANRLTPSDADRWRRRLWAAVEERAPGALSFAA